MAKIFSIKHRTDLDSLREKSPAHAALMRIIQRSLPLVSNNSVISGIADNWLEDLWREGFKVVPRDDKESG